MYGRENEYFGKKVPGFNNFIWIELIGFDNTLPDFGVGSYIKNLGFIPDGISFLLTSIDFVNMHKSMDCEYEFPDYYCSYAGHSHNDERERQNWTNYEFRSLIAELHQYGVKVYFSIFDWVREDDRSLTANHPEIKMVLSTGQISNHICMIKRFADGSYYEDYLLKKLLETARDYNFDGVHIGDGVSSPRMALQFAEFSDDVIDQSGIIVPKGEDLVQYITTKKRKEWIIFFRTRWVEFLTKIISGLRESGIESLVNSTWSRDPLEALYRYGTDYKAITNAGVTSFVVEDVSSDMAILSYEDNARYHYDYKRRRYIHHEFAASLMCIKAHLKNTSLTPLFMIRDTMEQWDVLHHMPTAMQRAAGTNLNNYMVNSDGSLMPVTNGPFFCLGDGLTNDDWKYIRLCWDNGYTKNVKDVTGATMIWSERRMENEIDSLIKHRTWHSAKWLGELLSRGAAVHKVAHIDDLDNVTGAILITNPDLLPKDEFEKLKAYNGGEIVFVGAPLIKDDYSEELNPNKPGFPVPINFVEVDERILQNCVEQINKNTVYISDGSESCNVEEIIIGENSSRFLVENEEYYYVLPKIHTGRAIKKVNALTKPRGYVVRVEKDTFKLRVPGRGMDVIEVEFE